MVWPFENLLNPFRHDLGFSADAHRHQFPFGLLSFKQVGLRFYSPLEGLDQYHLSVGCEVRLLCHPALPLVHQLSLVSPIDLLCIPMSAEPLDTSYDVIFISAMQIIWTEAP